jgi:hypothetical protein
MNSVIFLYGTSYLCYDNSAVLRAIFPSVRESACSCITKCEKGNTLVFISLSLVYFSLRSVVRLPVNANVVPSSPILVTLMTEVTHSYETSVHTRATRRHIQEDGVLHSHRRGNLKPYMFKKLSDSSWSYRLKPCINLENLNVY